MLLQPLLCFIHRHTHKHIRECDVLQFTVFDDDRQLVWSWAFHLCFYSHHTFTSETQICIVEEFIMPIKIVAEHFLALFWAGKMCFNVVHNVANSEGMSRNVWNKIELCWTPPLDIPAPLVIPWRQSKLDIVGDCGNVGRVNTEKASPSHCTALQKRRLFWPNDHCKMPEL